MHAVQEQVHSMLEQGRQLAAEHDSFGAELAAGGGSPAGEGEGAPLEAGDRLAPAGGEPRHLLHETPEEEALAAAQDISLGGLAMADIEDEAEVPPPEEEAVGGAAASGGMGAGTGAGGVREAATGAGGSGRGGTVMPVSPQAKPQSMKVS